jgi:4-amino-4-deoxy-L-arabinose transferase-like glycosyltransferase
MPALRAFILRLLDHPRAPVIVIAAGLVLRLAVLGLLARTALTGDAQWYASGAVALLGRLPFDPEWPPGVPSLVASGYAVFGAHEIVARAVMLPVYLAFSAAILALGRRIGGPRVANLALAVFAVTPIFVWTSVTPLTQLPTAALALGVVYFADRCRKGESLLMSAGFLGMCMAGLLLTRASNILLIAALPLYLAWKRVRWQGLVVSVAVVALFTSAWCFKAYSVAGHFVFINNANSENIFYGNNLYTPLYRTWWYASHKEQWEDVPPGFQILFKTIRQEPDLAARDKLFAKAATDHIRARPDLFLIRTVNRVRVLMGFDTFTCTQVASTNKVLGAVVLAVDASLYLLVTVLALLFPAVALSEAKGWAGLMKSAGGTADVASWREDRRQMIHLILVVSLLYACPYYVVFSHPTYHVPVTALVGMLGAMAGVAILETGLGPIWKGAAPRVRLWTVAALLAYAAIQVEWAVCVIGHAG